jgi:hypothetical protein
MPRTPLTLIGAAAFFVWGGAALYRAQDIKQDLESAVIAQYVCAGASPTSAIEAARNADYSVVAPYAARDMDEAVESGIKRIVIGAGLLALSRKMGNYQGNAGPGERR